MKSAVTISAQTATEKINNISTMDHMISSRVVIHLMRTRFNHNGAQKDEATLSFALNVIKLAVNLVFHFIRQTVLIPLMLCILFTSLNKTFCSKTFPKRHTIELSNGNMHIRSFARNKDKELLLVLLSLGKKWEKYFLAFSIKQTQCNIYNVLDTLERSIQFIIKNPSLIKLESNNIRRLCDAEKSEKINHLVGNTNCSAIYALILNLFLYSNYLQSFISLDFLLFFLLLL